MYTLNTYQLRVKRSDKRQKQKQKPIEIRLFYVFGTYRVQTAVSFAPVFCRSRLSLRFSTAKLLGQGV